MSREIRFRTLLPNLGDRLGRALWGCRPLATEADSKSTFLGRPDFVGEHRTLPWVALAVACKEVPLLRRSC